MKNILLILFLLPQLAAAQDTIRVGHKFKDFKHLEMGVKRDAVYNLFKGEIKGLAIKTRTTERVTIDGKAYISITHSWVSPGTEWKGNFQYLCEPETMKPVQHIRTTKRAGIEAFKFSGSKITGLDSISENTKNDFELTLTEPTYNWEVDLETYSLLPMKEGYHAVMNFYHPGGSTAPGFYQLKVTGSEKLELPNGQKMDCWIIFTDYGGTQPTRFWYTKKGQNFVKMEGQYNQMTIRKERIF